MYGSVALARSNLAKENEPEENSAGIFRVSDDHSNELYTLLPLVTAHPIGHLNRDYYYYYYYYLKVFIGLTFIIFVSLLIYLSIHI